MEQFYFHCGSGLQRHLDEVEVPPQIFKLTSSQILSRATKLIFSAKQCAFSKCF